MEENGHYLSFNRLPSSTPNEIEYAFIHYTPQFCHRNCPRTFIPKQTPSPSRGDGWIQTRWYCQKQVSGHWLQLLLLRLREGEYRNMHGSRKIRYSILWKRNLCAREWCCRLRVVGKDSVQDFFWEGGERGLRVEGLNAANLQLHVVMLCGCVCESEKYINGESILCRKQSINQRTQLTQSTQSIRIPFST